MIISIFSSNNISKFSLCWSPSTAEVKLAKVATRVAIIHEVIVKTKSDTCISYNYMYLGKHFWVKVGRRGQ